MAKLLLENGFDFLLENGNFLLLEDVVSNVEIKIVNNLIVDSNRQGWIGAIFTAMDGLNFYPFETKVNGLGYLQIGDRIEVSGIDDISREVVILGWELSLTGGVSEKFYGEYPEISKTNYNTAGIIGKRIRNTEIIVNKQTGEITIITEDLNEAVSSISLSINNITASVSSAIAKGDLNSSAITTLQSNLATLQLTSTALQVAVSGIGGTNLLKNSVGLKNTLTEWQILDVNGTLIDARNAGTIISDSDIDINSESGSGIRLLNQFITQTFSTILGQTYTAYFRYKSDGISTLSITGQTNITLTTQANWIVYKSQFVASSVSTTFRLETGVGITATFSDIVCKIGDTSGWIQAPNEVYGTNFRFDKDGFSITSLTDPFKSLLDNQKLAVYDTSGGSDKIVMLVSKDSGKITKLTAQDEFIVQRYENSSKSLRIIPTATGAQLVINS